MNEWLYEFYKENNDFREYVDILCKGWGISVDNALGLAVVEEVAKDYQRKERQG